MQKDNCSGSANAAFIPKRPFFSQRINLLKLLIIPGNGIQEKLLQK
jgi:hypothetical protein